MPINLHHFHQRTNQRRPHSSKTLHTTYFDNPSQSYMTKTTNFVLLKIPTENTFSTVCFQNLSKTEYETQIMKDTNTRDPKSIKKNENFRQVETDAMLT